MEEVMKTKLLSLITLFSILLIGPGLKAGPDFSPNVHPKLTVKKTDREISIDGKYGDPGWRNAAVMDNFCENYPGENTKPAVETRAYVTYDNSNLYAFIVCHDNPELIRASLCERDKISNDDDVCFMFDTYGDGAQGYIFQVNPRGIQGDAIFVKGNSDDFSYDLIWHAAAQITDSGYQVELAIPFSSLRFPDKNEQQWSLDIMRHRPREIEYQYCWSAYDRNETCLSCNWGSLHGIEDVSPGQGIEILPSLIGYQSGSLSDLRDPSSDWQRADIDGEISMGIKYSLSSSLVAEATFNPDFSQVESDATQIDVNTTFALFYPEKRPFFQEGSDLYNSWIDVVYTRSINDPQYAAKLVNRSGRTSIALLTARDQHSPIILPFEENSAYIQAGKSISNIFRLRRTMGDNSLMGLVLTDRRFEDGGSGTLFGVDGDIRLSQNFYLQWMATASRTAEDDDPGQTAGFGDYTFDDGKHTAVFDGEKFWGHALYGSTGYSSRGLVVDVSYFERSPTFRAANGFEPVNNQRKVSIYSGYNFYPQGKIFQKIRPYVMAGRVWNFNGLIKDEYISLEADFRAIGQTGIHPRFYYGAENFAGIQFDNIWMAHYCMNSQLSKTVGLGMAVNYGNQIARNVAPAVMGRELSLYLSLNLRPVDRITFSPSYRYMVSDELGVDRQLFEIYTTRMKINYQFSRELSFRLITQYNDYYKNLEIDPLITYQINPFTMLYAGSTHDIHDYENFNDTSFRQTSQQFFFKIQYLMQI